MEAIITEVEAYGAEDPASHSYKGITGRNRSMFLAAGRAYVYFVYGMHWCLNVVAGKAGSGEAILIRAILPADGTGLRLMWRNRFGASSSAPDRLDLVRAARLSIGPAKSAQALGVSRSDDGCDLLAGEGRLRLLPVDGRLNGLSVQNGVRVGVSRSRELPLSWRYDPAHVIDIISKY